MPIGVALGHLTSVLVRRVYTVSLSIVIILSSYSVILILILCLSVVMMVISNGGFKRASACLSNCCPSDEVVSSWRCTVSRHKCDMLDSGTLSDEVVSLGVVLSLGTSAVSWFCASPLNPKKINDVIGSSATFGYFSCINICK